MKKSFPLTPTMFYDPEPEDNNSQEYKDWVKRNTRPLLNDYRVEKEENKKRKTLMRLGMNNKPIDFDWNQYRLDYIYYDENRLRYKNFDKVFEDNKRIIFADIKSNYKILFNKKNLNIELLIGRSNDTLYIGKCSHKLFERILFENNIKLEKYNEPVTEI